MMAGLITDDTELFIDAIEKKPPLYDQSLIEYSDTALKKKLWEQVCAEVVSEWELLESDRRHQAVVEVQKKWANLRTCFTRELRAQKIIQGPAAKKRRKYLYFEKLHFLKPSCKEQVAIMESDIGDESENQDYFEPQLESLSTPFTYPPEEKANLQECLLNLLKDSEDEDKNFALSLIPSLRSLSEDEKLQAKIEILRVFQRIKTARNSVPADMITTPIADQESRSYEISSTGNRKRLPSSGRRNSPRS